MKHHSESDTETENSVAQYRHLNNLVFARPSSANLISERTQKLSYPASLTYTTASTMQFVINSGSEFVWGPSSYLKCRIGMSCAGAPIINGSFLNLFSQIRLYHRSGELLEQVFFSDILANIKLRYETSFSDYVKLAPLIGASPVPGVPGTPYLTGVVLGGAEFFVNVNLPLSFYLGVFDNHSQFIPSQLLAGARLELVINTDSAVQMGMTNINITSISPVLSLDCAKLYDEASKQILEESADVQESGIQFTYNTFFASQFKPAAGAINIDVLQSASLTEKVFLVNAIETYATTQKYKFLSLNPAGYSYQFRIGSHYLPIYAIQDDTEAFNMAQIAFNGAYNQYSRPPSHTGISVNGFYNDAHEDAINCVYATSLEKSASNVALSGQPTNNSRLINFSAQGTAVAFTTTIFLEYVRVANCMLDSCVVDR